MRDLLLGSAALFVFASSAAAQTPPNASAIEEDSTEQASADRNYGDIVVTAQRREERLQDVPLTVVTTSDEELERAGVHTIRDLSRLVSGFTLSGQGFQVQPAIRGVSTFVSDGTGSGPNALYIDGVYQPLFTALSAEMSDIQRIEVLKGPQGTLFGRNATGGAVQVFTKRPSFEPHMDLRMSLGWFTGDGGSRSSLNSRVAAFVSLPIVADTVAASVSGGYRYAPGYLTNDLTGERDGEIKKAYARGKLLIKPTDNLELLAEAHYIDFDNFGEGAQAAHRGLTAANFPLFAGSIIPRQPWHIAYNDTGDIFYNQQGVSLTAKLDLGFGTFTSVTAWDRGHVNVLNSVHGARGTPTCLAFFSCLDTNFDSVTKTFQQELNFASRDFGRFSFTAGLFYLDLNASTDFFINPQIIPPQGLQAIDLIVDGKSYAAYGEVTLDVTDRLTVIAGLRYSRDTNDDSPFTGLPRIRREQDAFTPRLSIKLEATDKLNLYATFSQGYKAGLSGASNAGSVPPFQPVDAEKITSYEIGAKYADRNLSFNLSGWYYDYKNKQESVFSGTSPILQNTGPVRLYGLDADARLRLNENFSITANASYIPVAKFLDYPAAAGYSFVQGPTGSFLPGIGLVAQSCPAGAPAGCVATGTSIIDVTGFRIPRAPKFSANATIAYENKTAAGTFDASVTVSYSSTIYHTVNHAVVQPGVALLSAQAGYEFAGGLRLGVYGTNLANQAVIQGSISSSAGHLQTLNAPREIGINLGYSY